MFQIKLYSIQFLHQITTASESGRQGGQLYSIQFLHQITTLYNDIGYQDGCIVSNFYIKSQPSKWVRNWLIRCIVSNFYIKSQRFGEDIMAPKRCIVSNFYIKSQRSVNVYRSSRRCIVSNFYIKSQPQVLHLLIIRVLHPYVPRKSDVRRTEEVDSMQFFRSAKQIYQKNSSC